MLIKLHRFHGRNSLRGIYQRGRTIRSGLVNLKVNQRGAGQPYRVAVVVSRKVHKSAVVRNRIRRRIYELCRQADAPELTGLDLVFTVFSHRVAELDSAELTKIIDGLLQKAQKSPGQSG